jgi:hypothetical protein
MTFANPFGAPIARKEAKARQAKKPSQSSSIIHSRNDSCRSGSRLGGVGVSSEVAHARHAFSLSARLPISKPPKKNVVHGPSRRTAATPRRSSPKERSRGAWDHPTSRPSANLRYGDRVSAP